MRILRMLEAIGRYWASARLARAIDTDDVLLITRRYARREETETEQERLPLAA